MAETELNAIKIGVSTLEDVKARTRAAFSGKPQALGQVVVLAFYVLDFTGT